MQWDVASQDHVSAACVHRMNQAAWCTREAFVWVKDPGEPSSIFSLAQNYAFTPHAPVVIEVLQWLQRAGRIQEKEIRVEFVYVRLTAGHRPELKVHVSSLNLGNPIRQTLRAYASLEAVPRMDWEAACMILSAIIALALSKRVVIQGLRSVIEACNKGLVSCSALKNRLLDALEQDLLGFDPLPLNGQQRQTQLVADLRRVVQPWTLTFENRWKDSGYWASVYHESFSCFPRAHQASRSRGIQRDDLRGGSYDSVCLVRAFVARFCGLGSVYCLVDESRTIAAMMVMLMTTLVVLVLSFSFWSAT